MTELRPDQVLREVTHSGSPSLRPDQVAREVAMTGHGNLRIAIVCREIARAVGTAIPPGEPHHNDDWPLPRRPIYPIELRTWTQSLNLNLLPTAAPFFGSVGMDGSPQYAALAQPSFEVGRNVALLTPRNDDDVVVTLIW